MSQETPRGRTTLSDLIPYYSVYQFFDIDCKAVFICSLAVNPDDVLRTYKWIILLLRKISGWFNIKQDKLVFWDGGAVAVVVIGVKFGKLRSTVTWVGCIVKKCPCVC